jgi:hypothetical protein
MGVDSYIFDEVSKDCFYFDRRHNFILYGMMDDSHYDSVLDSIYNMEHGRATSEEIVYMCDFNINYYKYSPEVDERDRRRAGWNENIKKFALARPDGSFFTQSDHDSPESWEVRDKGNYREVRYNLEGIEELRK